MKFKEIIYYIRLEIYKLSLCGAFISGNLSIRIFIGICVEIPLNMHVPTGNVGMDSSVILSIYDTAVEIALKSLWLISLCIK